MGTKNKTNEIRFTRHYEAPLKAVWDAWTDPKQVAKWWGPRGFTITTHSKDLRVGGIWHYTMHGPDGVDYPNKTIYHEVEKYSKLVYDHGGYDERKPLFKVTVLFTEEKGKTKMDMTMAFESIEAAIEIGKFIKQASGYSTWDRLAEFLDDEAECRGKFVINRTFDAPLNLMFEMWTNPKHLAQWMPPTGFKMEFLKSEIKENSTAVYYMSNGEGAEMYGKSGYKEIKRPNFLSFTQQFCDKDQNIIRHPMAPIWPETWLTTVSLFDEGDDQTRVTVSSIPFGKVTQEELEAFMNERAGMTVGWTGSFDKLESYIEKL